MVNVLNTDAGGNALAIDKNNSAQSKEVGYDGLLTPVGNYFGHSGALTVQSSAHGSTAGFVFLANPVASTVKVRVKKVTVTISAVTAAAFLTAPRITCERETFTGSAGATIALGLRKSGDTAATATYSTSGPGTPTAGNKMFSTIVPAVLTGVGAAPLAIDVWKAKDKNDEIELGAGEALVWRQADAGSGSDTRILTIDVEWYEAVYGK